MTAVTYAKIDFLGVDGHVMGTGRVRIADREDRLSLDATIGNGYEAQMVIPNSEKGDPRCQYRLRMTLE